MIQITIFSEEREAFQSVVPARAMMEIAMVKDAEGNATGQASAERTILPQFALDAADAKIATVSGAIVDTANTIEQLVSAESLPVPDTVRDLATSTTQRLRDLGARAGENDAAELVAGLQRTAAAHPAAAIGTGAAIGAALAALLVRLGSQNAAPQGQSGEASAATQ